MVHDVPLAAQGACANRPLACGGSWPLEDPVSPGEPNAPSGGLASWLLRAPVEVDLRLLDKRGWGQARDGKWGREWRESRREGRKMGQCVVA